MFGDYFLLLVFIGFGFLVGIVPTMISRFFISKNAPYKEKLESYECGFDPLSSDTKDRFDVKFYLISVIFIIFDLELAFLFPWAVAFSSLPIKSIIGVFIFLAEFLVVYAYIWKRGALEWE
ncbi:MULTISPECIES: NADH-quinone oxidoreductase subunit A [Candidatus Ichthyocystis]|uniref:NADH-quinone oxidoreductase subunit A n=1 Tax=Candidatus Ichthyocystis hellenicum TaxID=1561003 RepID=A0A0S4M243_9BURK|nr:MULTISPECIES: NADH-quinone oxidoreductase subunit A [Ichthyocystis]CUT17847.1 NAD(P)H-quinone oxidoreductase subunit A [Candidatus Ichthyocystis hellenicum]